MSKIIKPMASYVDPSEITIMTVLDKLTEYPENYVLARMLKSMAMKQCKSKTEWKNLSLRTVLKSYFDSCYRMYASKVKDRTVYGEKFIFNKAVERYAKNLTRFDDCQTLARAIGSDIIFELVVDPRMDLTDMSDVVKDYLFNSNILVKNSKNNPIVDYILANDKVYDIPEAYARSREDYFIIDATKSNEMGD